MRNDLDRFHLLGTVKLPTIHQHTAEQLDAAIERAAKLPDFYVLLHGIDAYMERRRRRRQAARARREDRLHRHAMEGLSDPWGNS